MAKKKDYTAWYIIGIVGVVALVALFLSMGSGGSVSLGTEDLAGQAKGVLGGGQTPTVGGGNQDIVTQVEFDEALDEIKDIMAGLISEISSLETEVSNLEVGGGDIDPGDLEAQLVDLETQLTDLETDVSGLESFDISGSGENSIALGENAISNSLGSVALGDRAEATGASSIAIGSTAVANGGGTISMGVLAEAGGSGSIAIGQSTDASGSHSVSMGYNAETNADYSMMLRAKGITDEGFLANCDPPEEGELMVCSDYFTLNSISDSAPDASGNAGALCITNDGGVWVDNDGTYDCE